MKEDLTEYDVATLGDILDGNAEGIERDDVDLSDADYEALVEVVERDLYGGHWTDGGIDDIQSVGEDRYVVGCSRGKGGRAMWTEDYLYLVVRESEGSWTIERVQRVERYSLH